MTTIDKDLQQINREVVELYQNGEYSEAMELATQALEFGKKFLGSKHPITTTSVNNLAILVGKIGDPARV
ncbi:MAG: tetratricopeptide repeat protein [Nitrospina sp.]|jgi:hypothetical protein|nr:tetratricopeptide repeat protein [Nitrospina sp.]